MSNFHSTTAAEPQTKPHYPVYHAHMAGASDWIINLLRLYDPAQLAAKDQAFLLAEIERYVTEATEAPSLEMLTALLRADLLHTFDEWLHRDGRRRYQRYLATDTWQSKRGKVMKRAGGLCEGCRDKRATEVHHLNYGDPRGEEMLFNLVALCRDCHEAITKRQKDKAAV